MFLIAAYALACVINPGIPVATVYLIYQYPGVAISSFVAYKLIS